jgi:hypothetical protein
MSTRRPFQFRLSALFALTLITATATWAAMTYPIHVLTTLACLLAMVLYLLLAIGSFAVIAGTALAMVAAGFMARAAARAAGRTLVRGRGPAGRLHHR